MSLGALLAIMGGFQGAPQLRSTAVGANAATAGKPTGVAVGDLVIIAAGNAGTAKTLSTTGGGSWSRVGSVTVNTPCDIFWKILDATDVANSWAWNTGTTSSISAAFKANGARTLTQKDYTASATGATTATSSGYVPNAATRGVITVVFDTDTTQPAVPLGHTAIVNFTDTNYILSMAQRGTYRGGSITWTGFATGHVNGLWVFEIT